MGYEVDMLVGRAHGDGPLAGWFQVYARLDLSKIGDCALAQLVRSSHNQAMWDKPGDFGGWYFYADDGDTRVTEDKYGERMMPVSVALALEAARHSGIEYRRMAWAVALLAAMVADREGLSVMFYGH